MPIVVTAVPDPSCPGAGLFAWDTSWDNRTGSGDWHRADPVKEPWNAGGLAAAHGIETAVILALFTDKRPPPGHRLYSRVQDGDLRGCWADALAISDGDDPLGSYLWILENNVCTDAVRRDYEAEALDALMPLVRRGLAAKVSAAATILPMQNGMSLAIALAARDGTNIFDRHFDVLWNQVGVR